MDTDNRTASAIDRAGDSYPLDGANPGERS